MPLPQGPFLLLFLYLLPATGVARPVALQHNVWQGIATHCVAGPQRPTGAPVAPVCHM